MNVPPMILARLSLSALLVAPVRIALGLLGLGVSLARGEQATPAGLAFVIGTFGMAFAIVADRRGGIFAQRSEPEPAPSGAAFESRLELVRRAMMPSTVGVAVLAAIAFVAGQLSLGALLSGAVAGMGLASLVYGAVTAWQERESGAALYLNRREGRVYVGAPR
jgi:hypothetical protein